MASLNAYFQFSDHLLLVERDIVKQVATFCFCFLNFASSFDPFEIRIFYHQVLESSLILLLFFRCDLTL